MSIALAPASGQNHCMMPSRSRPARAWSQVRRTRSLFANAFELKSPLEDHFRGLRAKLTESWWRFLHRSVRWFRAKQLCIFARAVRTAGRRSAKNKKASSKDNVREQPTAGFKPRTKSLCSAADRRVVEEGSADFASVNVAASRACSTMMAEVGGVCLARGRLQIRAACTTINMARTELRRIGPWS